MLLSNLSLLTNDEPVDILLNKEKILSVNEHIKSQERGHAIQFTDAIVFPGLINSHDHLDFNLFPQLGNKIYNNYVDWGEDIHQQNKDIISNVLRIPEQYRIQWGIYKNLLNGITTVVNHGPKITDENSPINIWQNTHSLHSIRLEKKWKYKLNIPFLKKLPFSIHIGEGTDKAARDEISRLIKWNLLNRKLIGIHGVAMNEEQASQFEALVWCPDSNYFLLGRTATIDKLKDKTKILFGTDSTVSSHWSIWEHLRLARKEKMVSDMELFNMLNTSPANVWNISSCGVLSKDYNADIVIARKKPGLKKMDVFFSLNPEDLLLVLHKGAIQLFDEELYPQLKGLNISLQNFYKINIHGRGKHVYGNLPRLIESVRSYYPDAGFPITY